MTDSMSTVHVVSESAGPSIRDAQAAAGQHAAILFENPLSGREEGCQRTEEPRNRQAV